MNELIAIAIIGAYMAAGYLLIYPRAKSIGQLRWLDVILSLATIVTVGGINFTSDEVFTLVFFDTNWFVFTLVAYIAIETPLWYLYMKAHPEQGTLAQLYGFTGKSKSEKVAKNIDQVMRDTKWDAVRTSRAQRLLVILGALSLIGSPILFWFEDFIKPGIGILSVLPIFLIWWLLRISVRLVADAPDEYLDELQIQQRDRTYLQSFRVLAALVSALAVALMIITISKDVATIGNVEYYDFRLTFGQINAVVWSILGSTILVPNMVLAWNQAKGVHV
jgi:hypothetical protein